MNIKFVIKITEQTARSSLQILNTTHYTFQFIFLAQTQIQQARVCCACGGHGVF